MIEIPKTSFEKIKEINYNFDNMYELLESLHNIYSYKIYDENYLNYITQYIKNCSINGFIYKEAKFFVSFDRGVISINIKDIRTGMWFLGKDPYQIPKQANIDGMFENEEFECILFDNGTFYYEEYPYRNTTIEMELQDELL